MTIDLTMVFFENLNKKLKERDIQLRVVLKDDWVKTYKPKELGAFDDKMKNLPTIYDIMDLAKEAIVESGMQAHDINRLIALKQEMEVDTKVMKTYCEESTSNILFLN